MARPGIVFDPMRHGSHRRAPEGIRLAAIVRSGSTTSMSVTSWAVTGNHAFTALMRCRLAGNGLVVDRTFDWATTCLSPLFGRIIFDIGIVEIHLSVGQVMHKARESR